ncbi:MAG TPA: HAD-IIIA family hydrolase [Intrasporangium sp.]|uniref:HAD-IIIA family hydrolase n=1 Tax=Intrasporangium sp. TaxID=1925024 RepID=UPI002D79F35C|nr:HAD-IIIA family hydrolase [Intrasporangium sp.]HET7399674.1 HAD-IIIA family hydrolase [Intrasporangium sp.]
MGTPLTTVVVPSVGRPSLRVLLEALAGGTVPVEGPVVVVDDRPVRAGLGDLGTELAGVGVPGLTVVRSGGRGPAAARNLGWRRARTPWVSFLDDDVVPDVDWYAVLRDDLRTAGADVAGSQGRVRVPLPEGRRPTDWERSTAGLQDARWITADLSYRRSALAAVGGFDERFPRAFREDSDLGLRVTATHGRITRGERWVTHPVRPADDWVSVRRQAGNGDDVLMRRLHGPDWRDRAGAPRGRRRRHLLTATAGAVGGVALAAGRRRTGILALTGWLAGTAELLVARVAPGPRDPDELRRMALTSAAIPFAATWHVAVGVWRHRRAQPWRGVPELVLFDRDGTLVHDVPYNGDPDLVTPVAGAREALDQLRHLGVRVGVVTNQSGVARGRLTLSDVAAVNARVEELLGPLDVWQLCPHGPDDGCACRKPAPGMVKAACAALDVDPSRCVVVGDIGSDVRAATAAGAAAVLVPTAATRREEVEAADHVCPSLTAAVADIVGGRW